MLLSLVLFMEAIYCASFFSKHRQPNTPNAQYDYDYQNNYFKTEREADAEMRSVEPDLETATQMKMRQDKHKNNANRKLDIVVKMVISSNYLASYQETHTTPLTGDIEMAVAATTLIINNLPMIKKARLTVAFKLENVESNPEIMSIVNDSSVCGGGVVRVASMLSEIRKQDPNNHYLALLDCQPEQFKEEFKKVQESVSIVTDYTNVLCTRYTSMFYAPAYVDLFTYVANALMRALGENKPLTAVENFENDKGVMPSLMASDSMMEHAVHSHCFKRDQYEDGQ